MNDFSRQKAVFNKETFDTPVHVIGAGATGSWLTLMLAKMGIEDITVWDFDEVEEHNLPNQVFRLETVEDPSESNKYSGEGTDIGRKKVRALYNLVELSTGAVINCKDEEVTGDQKLGGIVFVLTDTMKSRSNIFYKALRYKYGVEMVVETRMGLTGGRVYALDPKKPKHIRAYEETLYSDDDSDASACGASQSIVSTANIIANFAVWQLIKWHNNGFENIDNEIMLDAENNNILTRSFE